MKVWIKLTKHFQGGSRIDYMIVDKKNIDTHDKEQELMENWGENSDGGHNYGYKVYMEKLKRKELPPKEWFEKAIKKCQDNLGYLKSSIERTEELLLTYTDILAKFKNESK
jgi:hypothetical protein